MTPDVPASAATMSEIPAVVVGGFEWNPASNYPQIHTVRELARTRPVLHIHAAASGGMRDRLRDFGRHPTKLLRTSTRLRVRRDGETLWLAALDGISVFSPLAFPEPVRRHNVRLCRRAIEGWLRAIGHDRCVLFFYWWFVDELVEAIPNVGSVYDCTDEHASYPGSALREGTVRRLEGRMLDAVDASFVVSPGLLAPREGPGRDLTVLPGSFEVGRFAEIVDAGLQVPEALRGVAGPVVGCSGALGGRVDVPMMYELVRRRPDWTFAFIGADPPTALPELVGKPNVLMLGSMPYPEAIGAMSRYDVGLIPFVPTPFTLGNSPMKLTDHLAHGTPVVSTPLPGLLEAADQDLVWLAEGTDAWEAAIAEALAEPADSPRREARRRFVEGRDAPKRVQRMLDAALGPRASRGAAPVKDTVR